MTSNETDRLNKIYMTLTLMNLAFTFKEKDEHLASSKLMLSLIDETKKELQRSRDMDDEKSELRIS